MNIVLKNLQKFLIESNQKGYAVSGEAGNIRENDGSKSFRYQSGDWTSDDNYFGGEPYGGRSVVHFKGKPVWMMVYYGAMAEGIEDFEPVYGFLRKALLNMPEESPFRGPEKLIDGDLRYENKWFGDLTNFSGEEKIFIKEVEVFYTKYSGGVINMRED